MLNVNVKEIIFTGAVKKTSKNGNDYTVINFLNGVGESFSCMFKGDSAKLTGLSQLQKVSAIFKFEVGKYNQLYCLDVQA